LSNTLTQPLVNVLGRVSVNTKIICKVTLSLGLLSPQTLHSRVSIKYGNFINSLNAQGSRLIIVALHVGAVKIYAVELAYLKKKERQRSAHP